jgi:hypothetical protein
MSLAFYQTKGNCAHLSAEMQQISREMQHAADLSRDAACSRSLCRDAAEMQQISLQQRCSRDAAEMHSSAHRRDAADLLDSKRSSVIAFAAEKNAENL